MAQLRTNPSTRRPRAGTAFATCLLALMIAGCAARGEPACAPDEKLAASDTLYFGSATPDGMMRAEEWTAFLKEVVTPRFPRGFTVLNGNGQWRSADGTIVREPSFVLNVLHAPNDQDEADIRQIVSEYKRRHRQEAVLRVRSTACVSY